jgi:hypothetical protein
MDRCLVFRSRITNSVPIGLSKCQKDYPPCTLLSRWMCAIDWLLDNGSQRVLLLKRLTFSFHNLLTCFSTLLWRWPVAFQFFYLHFFYLWLIGIHLRTRTLYVLLIVSRVCCRLMCKSVAGWGLSSHLTYVSRAIIVLPCSAIGYLWRWLMPNRVIKPCTFAAHLQVLLFQLSTRGLYALHKCLGSALLYHEYILRE